MAFTWQAPLNDRLIRAFCNFTGIKVGAFEITKRRPGVHSIKDPKSGAWADYDTTGWRVRRIAYYLPEDGYDQ